jgi:hypothetical protein
MLLAVLVTVISRDFVFVRTFLRSGPSRVLGSPLFSHHSWPPDLMGRAAITGTLPSPPAKIVDAHSRKLSEVDPDRSSSDLIFRKTPGASDRSFLRRLVDGNRGAAGRTHVRPETGTSSSATSRRRRRFSQSRHQCIGPFVATQGFLGLSERVHLAKEAQGLESPTRPADRKDTGRFITTIQHGGR